MSDLEKFDLLWEEPEEAVDAQQIEKAWNKHEGQIFNRPKKSNLRRIVYISTAAAAAIAFIFVIFSKSDFNTSNNQTPSTVSATTEWVQSIAPESEVATINLPDGTQIVLSPGAGISYPKKFTTDRQVKLSGDAYFNVVKDAAHPFQITAGNWTSTVLGTSFFIKHLDSNDGLSIQLFEGKVKVKNANENKSYILHGGQQIDFDQNMAHREISSMFSNAISSDGFIDFEETPLNYALGYLSTHYQVSLEINKVQNPLITYRWDLNGDLTSQLEILKELTGLQMAYKEGEIVVGK